MGTTPKHSVSVAGIVIDDHDRVLVIRRADNNHWEAPGGVLELDESFEDGVQREVAEETGMQVTVDSLSGVYKNLARGIVALVFRCTPRTTSIHPTAEAREVRWMTRDEIRQHMDPAFAIRALDAFEPGTQFRAHDGVPRHVLTQAVTRWQGMTPAPPTGSVTHRPRSLPAISSRP